MSYVNDTHTESSKIVHINSIDADVKYSSDRTTDFSYQLEQPIRVPENQLLLVSCIGATIPYTFYNIRSQINNRLCVRLTESGTIYNIDIPAGNYSSTSLLLKIKEIFDGLAITETINITYDRNTMKFLFSIVGGSGTCWFDFTTETNPYPLNVELGFSLSKTQITTNTPSPNVADVNGTINGLYLRSDKNHPMIGAYHGGDIRIQRMASSSGIPDDTVEPLMFLDLKNQKIGVNTDTFHSDEMVHIYKNGGGDNVVKIHEDAGTHKGMLYFRVGGNDVKLYATASDSTLNIDTENKERAFVIDTWGKVGIGTTSPKNTLDVTGSISSSQNVYAR